MKKEKMVDKHLMKRMDSFQLARWIALFEGVNIIADNAEKNGKLFDYMHIKQPALEEFVDFTSILIYKELTGKVLR